MHSTCLTQTTTVEKPAAIVLLAGTRPGGDRLTEMAGVAAKPLVEVGGITMLERTHAVLREWVGPDCPIVVLSNCTAALEPVIARISDPSTVLREGSASISQGLATLFGEAATSYPLLVTTADNVLVSSEILDCMGAGASGADVAIGVVEKACVHARFPRMRRTWIPFRGGSYSGANLFWFGGPRAARVVQTWGGGEQERKRGLKVLSQFGIGSTIAAALRIIRIEAFAERVGRRMGLQAKVVNIPAAEACVDVDSIKDLELARVLLAQNRAGD